MTKKIIYFEPERAFNYLTGFKELNWSAPNNPDNPTVTRIKSVATKRCG